MEFTYKTWEIFCRELAVKKLISIPGKDVLNHQYETNYIVLKHDVETNVKKAYKIASIEKKYDHRGSYYVQAYLLNDSRNLELLHQMQKMGHEITYHYDVMDSNHGNLSDAIEEFEKYRRQFEQYGFPVKTVCQHGNPLIERKGYSSNRDFFRSSIVQEKYPYLADIMVDFPQKANTEYDYYSDAGRKFQKIYDPFTNDITKSNDKNEELEDLQDLLRNIDTGRNHIISMHPHRWTSSSADYFIKSTLFKGIKLVAKTLYKIPVFQKIMSRYYYLAKKI